MATPAEPRQQVQFAEFALDLRTGELLQDGEKLVLPYQSFQILAALLEQPGELVTREELVQRLWASDVFVDFEGSLNKAMKRLREALHDSADEPRFIETLPRRGYRFIAPVASACSVPAVPQGFVGKKVSHYRVLEIIGGGGMGMVYKAEDLRLGRRVALKFLPEELASDSVALQRFEREARTASSLNHPNICTIYEVEEHEGQPFIVMELLEGETLRDRLASSESKAVPVDELLGVATQICDGLEAAHRKGIIHRDIKPANIFLTTSGQAKILDFGLAKLMVEAPGFSPAKEEEEERAGLQPRPGLKPDSDDEPKRRAEARLFHQPATPAEATLSRTGVAMGTAGYMSPEQVRGEKLDARTDLFSFGLVLYEMATGQRAFSGDTAAVLREAILSSTPFPVRELNAALPPKLEQVINKALEKDREQRYQSAAEMRDDLELLRTGKRSPARLTWKWLAAASLLILIAAGGWLYWRSRSTIKLTAKDTIVLGDFTNTTGDPVFNGTLRQALAIQLEQSPFLNVLSEQKIVETLKLMKRPASEPLTQEVAREVCLRSNSRALLAGSIAALGEHFLITVKAVNCQNGDTIASAEGETASRNEVVKVLSDVANGVRKQLGESLASVEKFNQPLEEATTSSLEALQVFTQARRIQREKGNAEALSYLQHAVQLDPKFAYGHNALGITYLNLGQTEAAMQSFKQAYQLRASATPRERFHIDASYYKYVTGEWEKSVQTYKEWIEDYPEDVDAHTALSHAYRILGEHDKAAAEAQTALRIMPANYAAAFNLATSLAAMGRLEEAKAVLNEVQAHHVDDAQLHLARYWIAFVQGDDAVVQEQIAWANSVPRAEGSLLLTFEPAVEAYYGRFAKARELSKREFELLAWSGEVEKAALVAAQEGQWEVEIGNTQRARAKSLQALNLSKEESVAMPAAATLARSGDVVEATKLVDKLDRDHPLDTSEQKYYLPTIRAILELQRNNPEKSQELLSVVRPYELGFGAPCASYIRGLVYLRLNQGHEAAAEFQRILDHRELLNEYAQYAQIALARLQLGRAQAMMGDKDAARKSYQDFLTLWKDADPDTPIYQQAKAEYAKLQ